MKLIHIVLFLFIGTTWFLYREKKSINNHWKFINYIRKESQV